MKPGLLSRIFRPIFADVSPAQTTAEIEGIHLKIPAIASDVIRKAILDGTYEINELKLVRNRLRPDDVVMEVGAGMGLLSTFCAKQIGSDRVFTFEANPALEAAIRENYSLNGVSPTLEIGLVGEHAGTGTFYVGKNFWSSSIFNRAQGARPIEVPIISFNDKIKEIDPTFLIIDIEGGEFQLKDYAKFHNARKLMMEFHGWLLSPDQVQSVKDWLTKEGFKQVEAAGKEELYFER